MSKLTVKIILAATIVLVMPGLCPLGVRADAPSPSLTVTGYVRNNHGEPVVGALVTVSIGGAAKDTRVGPAKAAQTDDEGDFLLHMVLTPAQEQALRQANTRVVVHVTKSTFADGEVVFRADDLATEHGHYYAEPNIVLERKPTAAVFLAAGILALVYVLMSFERLHRTVAALLGAGAILFITHVVGPFNPNFVILPFERAITYIDLNVIFLLMAMMVLVTITARTGVFQWLAVVAYRLAKGNVWRLVVFLMTATAILSAFLDNVTTMLLMVPVTIEIALILRLNALTLLLPEVFASNIGGSATLIGDPPNLLIGSYANLGFESFIAYLTPAVILTMVGLVAIVWIAYGKQYPQSTAEETRALLLRLEKEFTIKDRSTLRQALFVFAGVVVLFLLSSVLKMEPSVPALAGMVVLLIWTEADIVHELEGVEWPSLLFFIGLFIVIGAANETGVIEALGDAVSALAGGNLVLAIILVVWITALASMLVDNIPITATMLPVVAFLTHTIPGATNNVLYWALALGACFGGNGTIVGASANIVTAGLAERAGYPVTFGGFARYGLPVTFVSLVIATLWLLLLVWLA